MLGEKKITFKTKDEALIDALEDARKKRIRVRISYDGEYGKDGNEYDFGYLTRGFSGRVVGDACERVLFLRSRRRSSYGFRIADDHIIKIETSRVKDRRTLWEKT